MWQQRPARAPSVPLNSALAYLGVLVFAPAAPLYAAIPAFSPMAWRAELPDCIPVRVPFRDAVVLEPLRPPRLHCPQRSLFRRAGLQTTPPAARSARISAAKSPEPSLFHTTQSGGPLQTHKFCPVQAGRADTPPSPPLIPA